MLPERIGFGLGDMADDTADDVRPCFERLAVFVLERIAETDDFLGVYADFPIR